MVVGPHCKMVIFIPINQGFTYRYLIQTKIFFYLQQKAKKIVIFVPAPEDHYYDSIKLYKNVVLEDYKADEYDTYLNSFKFQKLLIYIRSAVQNGAFDITTTKEIYETNLIDNLRNNKKRISLMVIDLIIKSSRNFYLLRKLWFFLENSLYIPDIHQTHFNKYNPDILLVSSVGTFHYDQYFMRQAKKFGTKVITAVLSWDNTTTRGGPGAYSDLIISWTDVMKQELVNLNDIKENRVKVGGVAHYDYYFDSDFIWSKKLLLRYFRMENSKKIIFFATKSPNCYSSNKLIADIIAKAIDDGAISNEYILVIRLHPIYYRMKDTELVFQKQLNEINKLAEKYNHVVVNEPHIETDVMNYSMPDKEIKLLASLLKHSSLMVNMFSSLNIEASIFDTPLVNVSFENENNKSNEHKARFNIKLDLRQTHNQRIVNSDGVTMVYKSNDLISAIIENLAQPDKLQYGREKIVDTEVGAYRGDAGKRIANLIMDQYK
jgi:hypothetical protein